MAKKAQAPADQKKDETTQAPADQTPAANTEAPVEQKPTESKSKKKKEEAAADEVLTEDQMRTAMQDDMAKMSKGEKVKTVKIVLPRGGFVRELGGKFPEGHVTTVPVSLLDFYKRSKPSLMEDARVTGQHDAEGDIQQNA